MMAQLDSIRGGVAGSATTPTSEEDLLSVKSDDSDADSDCFVVINQAVDDHTRDNTLFAINSKRSSPVEVASEAVEDIATIQWLSSNDVSLAGLSAPAPVAAAVAVSPMASVAASAVNNEPPCRDGVVRYFNSFRKFQVL